jgi:hypothetical protein
MLFFSSSALLAVLVLRISHHKTHVFTKIQGSFQCFLFLPPTRPKRAQSEIAFIFGNNNKKPNAHFTHVAGTLADESWKFFCEKEE